MPKDGSGALELHAREPAPPFPNSLEHGMGTFPCRSSETLRDPSQGKSVMTESQKRYFQQHGCLLVSMVDFNDRPSFERAWKRRLNQHLGEFVYVPRLPERGASKDARVEAHNA